MHCLGKSYPVEQLPIDIRQCPIKVTGQKAEIFFPGAIFNTFVLSVEGKITILKSYDDKLTFIKAKLEPGMLYTVKVALEDAKTREVAIYKFDEFFPGFQTKGRIELKDSKTVFHCAHGSGPIVLQTNDPQTEVDAMLVSLDSESAEFAEINNPVERAAVKIVKDLNNHKIVENGNIKGILLGAKNRKINTEVNVFAKNVYPGSYCFVEDIAPGPAMVELVGKEGLVYKVKYKDFTGECSDNKVKKTMKGVIFDIKGGTFKFRQEDNKTEERTIDYETVVVPKRLKVADESEIKGSQMKAIEYIKQEIESGKEDVTDLFKRQIQKIKDNEFLCLFYLRYLVDRKTVDETDIKNLMKNSSVKFPKVASETLEDVRIVKMIFSKAKTFAGFKRILDAEINKTKLMKENPEYLEFSIKYAYEHLENPRVVVESIIDGSFRNWICYTKCEDGNYKRNLYRRMASMKFKKNEMKELFKAWLTFEEATGGNVEEVHSHANQFVHSLKKGKE